MKKLAFFSIIVAALNVSLYAVDGIAVSVAFTKQRERSCGGWRGDIVRVEIKDSRPISCDTLYRGIAHCPSFSPDGKQIAFFRDGDTWDRQNNTRVAGGDDYLSVMDIDGKNMRDLVTFSGDLAKNSSWRNGEDRLNDWPIGGWIYYNKPHHTDEIWRVNAADPSKHEKVLEYGATDMVRRWNLSTDGTCAAGDNFYRNAPHTFPGRKVGDCTAGCNATISCSGRFRSSWGWNPGSAENTRIEQIHGDYKMKGHSHFDYADWDKATGKCSNRLGQSAETVVYLSHAAEWLGMDSIGRGMELIRWAVNSDKWSMFTLGWQSWAAAVSGWGANQLLYNWIDWQPILATNNPPNTSTDASLSRCCTAGDFWVTPPKDEYIGTHYESISGDWLPYGTWSTTPLESVRNSWDLSGAKPVLKQANGAVAIGTQKKNRSAARKISVHLNGNMLTINGLSDDLASAKILDVKGRQIFKSDISNRQLQIPTAKLNGLYILQVSEFSAGTIAYKKVIRF